VLLLAVCGGLAILCAFAVLFVTWDVVERQFFPNMSTGLRHALLTLQAGVVTGVAGGGVYYAMRRQQRRLSATAERLSRFLESYGKDPSHPGRFDNPHLKHCRDVLACECSDCPMYDCPGERCWQIRALSGANHDHQAPGVEIDQCHDCEVYRRSCPDKLTELGESFNNLMFLLDAEAKQLGRMRAQMVEKEKMAAIGQLAAGIAHEVGNPLSSISSVVQMLKRSRASEPQARQLDLIETHIQRISGTMRQMVSLARPVVERWERVDLGQTLEEAVRLIRFDRRARGLEIMLEPRKGLPQTYALRGQLQQVFINLSLNALDAMPDGGSLTILAGRKRGDIIVTVADTGCGIAPETGRRVFEPFFTTKEPGHGTGLGLAVSYGIIQKHGGTIDFSSTPGKGTVFTVSLPILDKPPDTENGKQHHTTG
jgi:signal transduction histidine kinase